MLSYVILCVRSGQHLPGKNTIPEQISRDKTPYYKALDAADGAYRDSRIDVSVLEELLSGMLANQLVEVYQDATGSTGGLDGGST